MANDITVTGALASPAAPSDVDLCVVTGYLVGVTGRSLKGVECSLQNLYYPLTIGNNTLVLREHNRVVSDSEGKVEFEVLQGSRIRFQVPNLHGEVLFEGNVPAAATCDLLDIILPYVVSIAWDDASLAVAVDDEFDALLTGTLSDGTTCNVTEAVTVTSSDTGVVQARSGSGYLALAVGGVTLSADSFNPDVLDISKTTEGSIIKRASLPAASLPAPLVVTVS